MMDRQAIGARIQAARKKSGLTQEALAEAVGVNSFHISVIERGVKTPRLDTFVKIANALQVSTDRLLQDVVTHSSEGILSELSTRLSELPPQEQKRILNAMFALIEAYSES